MNLRGMRTATAVLMLGLGAAGCAEEQLTINVRGDFTIVREDGSTEPLLMEGRLYEERIGRRAFNEAWAVVTRGAAPYDALALSLSSVGSGDGDPVPLLAGLVIALPVPLRRGDEYPIGGAFPPPTSDMPMYWNEWGRRDLGEPGVGEVALRTFDYHTVGMIIENDFVATDAEGTIEVIERRDDWIELRVDIVGTDGAGQTVRLEGVLDIRAERFTPPIT